MDCVDYIFKIILLGNAGTGKTSLIDRYIRNSYSEHSTTTVGVELGSRIIELDGKTIKLQVWDLAGHDRYRTIIRSYYRTAMGVLFVYDMDNIDTLANIESWVDDLKHYCDKEVVSCLVGNKTDLEREPDMDRIEKVMKECGIDYHMEVSARTGEKVDEVFETMALKILERYRGYEKLLQNNNVKLVPQVEPKCCAIL